MDSTTISGDSTVAPQEPRPAQRFRQGAVIALIALLIFAGVFGLAQIPSNTGGSLGSSGPDASAGGIDRALVEALARNYPPVEQAEAYRAAADRRALVKALASYYPPVEQAEAYRAAAGDRATGE